MLKRWTGPAMGMGWKLSAREEEKKETDSKTAAFVIKKGGVCVWCVLYVYKKKKGKEI